LVFSIAVSRNWKIHQLDIHNAFLNGVLTEEVYMKQPPGFIDSSLPSHVCRLHKSLYGLKQAPRAWYTRLSDVLLSIGFRASKVDTSLFILSDGTNIFYLLVYVDDILLTGSNSAMLHHLIQLLSSEFKLRDLGVVHCFLGIEVQSTGMGLMLRQHKYIIDILTRAGMTSCKPVDTPVSPSKVILLPDHSFSDLTFTRPDICFAVNRVCQFMHAPTDSHWTAVKRILRYLKGTTSYGFHITRGSLLLYMALQMQIGLVVLMIASLRAAILSFLVRHRFLENPASNALLFAPLLRLSIKPLLMVPLKSFGFNTC